MASKAEGRPGFILQVCVQRPQNLGSYDDNIFILILVQLNCCFFHSNHVVNSE